MGLPRLRVRTLMAVVVVVALLLWGSMMGSRSYDFYNRARLYGEQERGWREIASSGRRPEHKQFQVDCVDYFALLAAKYRRAMWSPWSQVAPDPHAPGYDEWEEQERRTQKVVVDPHTPAPPSAPR
jgi:hypothetical protein